MLMQKENWPGLPKWPMAFVTGEDVTAEQAKEIIFRTDVSISYPSEYGMGNDRRFRERMIGLFGWGTIIDAQKAVFDKKDPSQVEELCKKFNCETIWQLSARWSERMGMIPTSYVKNDWLSTAYIGGPHGWCSPEGKIFSDGHNYGKWPSVEEIVQDWEALVSAFPFLDLVCTMFSGEQCEDGIVPVCSIIVKNGKVEVHEPDLTLHPIAPSFGSMSDFSSLIVSMTYGDYTRERGWPEEWIQEFAARSREVVQNLHVV